MSEIPAGVVLEAPQLEAPAFERLARVRVVDERELLCLHEGVRTVILHEAGTPKVWERGAWMRIRGAYVRLAARVLLAPDVPLQVPRGEVPLWMQGGVRGRVSARALGLLNEVALPLVRRLPSGMRPSSEGLARVLARGSARKQTPSA